MTPFRARKAIAPPRALAGALLLAAALAGCRREEPRVSLAESVLPRLSLRARVAQLVVPAVDAGGGAAARHWVTGDSVGGVLLRGGPARTGAATLAALRAAAPVPLLAVAELDGGAGALAPEATDLPPVRALAARGLTDAAREAGAIAGAEARALGVDLGLVTLPEIGAGAPAGLPRPDPAAGGEAVAAYLEGLRGEGVLAAVRLLTPRRSPADTLPVPVLRWDRARLDAVDLPVIRAALGAEADAATLPLLALPALTGDSVPLAVSPAATTGLLRRDLGFAGLLAAEVGPGSALAAGRGEARAAVAAVAAGADLLLGGSDPAAAIDSVVAAVRAGRIPAARVDEAVRRVLAAKERLRAEARPPVSPDSLRPLLRTPDALAAAREAAVAARVVLGAAPGATLRPCRAPLLLARPGDAPLFRGLAARRFPAMRALYFPAASDAPAGFGRALRRADCWLVVETAPGSGAALLDAARGLVARGESVRADSARAAATPARAAARPDSAKPAGARPDPPTVLVRLAAAPPDSLPAARSVVLAWGAGPEAQRAAAEALAMDAIPAEQAVPVRWPAAATLREAEAAEAGMSEAGLARADAAIRAAVEAGTFPGAALAVGRRGRLVRLRGYGRLPGGEGAVRATETLYDIASLTKVAGTTAAVMALVDDGRLRLDAPVQRYLPGFTGRYKDEVVVRHLLTHTSGLPAGEWLYGDARSPATALRQAMRASLRARPGERMEYSDHGFILLGALVEEVAGEPLDAYLARRVYAPLGMSSTMYLPPSVLRPFTAPGAARSNQGHVLRGVVHDANAYRLGGVAGHAGLFSTAADLAVYSQALLNGGSYGTQRVYSPETVKRFTTVRTRVGNRAWGWDVPAARSSAGSYFSPQSYGHTGFTGTSIWIDPTQQLFVVLLANRTWDNASQAAMLNVRVAVHDAVARSITDATIRPRPGSPAAIEEARRQKLERERKARLERERIRRQKQRPRPTRRPRGRRG
jgi:CubicO group peptidase (beta-lactamase class C family)/beta-glucosidase-like glycosyl hydrolase